MPILLQPTPLLQIRMGRLAFAALFFFLITNVAAKHFTTADSIILVNDYTLRLHITTTTYDYSLHRKNGTEHTQAAVQPDATCVRSESLGPGGRRGWGSKLASYS